jgi:hypothetical protein
MDIDRVVRGTLCIYNHRQWTEIEWCVGHSVYTITGNGQRSSGAWDTLYIQSPALDRDRVVRGTLCIYRHRQWTEIEWCVGHSVYTTTGTRQRSSGAWDTLYIQSPALDRDRACGPASSETKTTVAWSQHSSPTNEIVTVGYWIKHTDNLP